MYDNVTRNYYEDEVAHSKLFRDNNAIPCVLFVIDHYLDDFERVQLEYSEAGSVNGCTILNVLIMAMLNYPSIFLRGRQETQQICGVEDPILLPCIEDFKGLPYICAVIKESLCWRPI